MVGFAALLPLNYEFNLDYKLNATRKHIFKRDGAEKVYFDQVKRQNTTHVRYVTSCVCVLTAAIKDIISMFLCLVIQTGNITTFKYFNSRIDVTLLHSNVG